MLNSGLGLVIVPAACALALVKRAALAEVLVPLCEEIPFVANILPVAAACAMTFASAINQISAPSVSLEGKNIWILQTLPADPYVVLEAKRNLHICLCAPVSLISAIMLSLALSLDFASTVSVCVYSLVFTLFSATLGVTMDLKKPNLVWSNETVPIKQGMGVLFSMLLGWAAAILMFALGSAVCAFVPAYGILIITSCALALVTRLLTRWLKGKGAEIFSKL